MLVTVFYSQLSASVPESRAVSISFFLCRLKLKGLYMYAAGFYTYSIFALVFWETRRSDFGVSMVHHVATFILIAFSYIVRYVSNCVYSTYIIREEVDFVSLYAQYALISLLRILYVTRYLTLPLSGNSRSWSFLTFCRLGVK